MFKILCFYLGILLIFFFSSNCFGTDLSVEETSILDAFLRTVIEKSELGYVLYGKKPVCTQGFDIEDYFLNKNERHRDSIYIKEAIPLLRKLNLNNKKSNVIIHIYDGEDSLVKNCIHVLFINKSLLLDTVQSNLSLFQYVLGPDVSPQAFLDKLADPKEKFHSVLKNDKVLIGIILGFGAKNSLYASRLENLEEAFFSLETPPFKSITLDFGTLAQREKTIFLLKKPSLSQLANITPSFGYSSLEKEVEGLFQQIEMSSSKLYEQSPPFIFGKLKEDKETEKLIAELEQTQDKIKTLLSSKQFLRDVLQMLYPEETISTTADLSKKLSFNDSQIKSLPSLVAANIWRAIEDRSNEYQTAF